MNLQQLKSKIADVKAAEKNTAICVGNGLYAQVKGDHVSWIFRYRFGGKVKSVGLGSLDDVSMGEATKLAADKAGLVRHGHATPKHSRPNRRQPQRRQRHKA